MDFSAVTIITPFSMYIKISPTDLYDLADSLEGKTIPESVKFGQLGKIEGLLVPLFVFFDFLLAFVVFLVLDDALTNLNVLVYCIFIHG